MHQRELRVFEKKERGAQQRRCTKVNFRPLESGEFPRLIRVQGGEELHKGRELAVSVGQHFNKVSIKWVEAESFLNCR